MADDADAEASRIPPGFDPLAASEAELRAAGYGERLDALPQTEEEAEARRQLIRQLAEHSFNAGMSPAGHTLEQVVQEFEEVWERADAEAKEDALTGNTERFELMLRDLQHAQREAGARPLTDEELQSLIGREQLRILKQRLEGHDIEELTVTERIAATHLKENYYPAGSVTHTVFFKLRGGALGSPLTDVRSARERVLAERGGVEALAAAQDVSERIKAGNGEEGSELRDGEVDLPQLFGGILSMDPGPDETLQQHEQELEVLKRRQADAKAAASGTSDPKSQAVVAQRLLAQAQAAEEDRNAYTDDEPRFKLEESPEEEATGLPNPHATRGTELSGYAEFVDSTDAVAVRGARDGPNAGIAILEAGRGPFLLSSMHGHTTALLRELTADVHAFCMNMPELVLHSSVGQSFMTDRSKGFDLGLVVVLRSKAALPRYRAHPVHQAFLKKYGDYFQEMMALDWVN